MIEIRKYRFEAINPRGELQDRITCDDLEELKKVIKVYQEISGILGVKKG